MAQTAVLRGTQELVSSRIQETPGDLWAMVPAMLEEHSSLYQASSRDNPYCIVLSIALKGHKTPSSTLWGFGTYQEPPDTSPSTKYSLTS